MLPAFELFIPLTIAEACKIKLETGGTFLAGGTDILAAMHSGKEQYGTLIDLKNIEELKHFETGDGLLFGSLTPHRIFEQSSLVKNRYTALYEGCSQVGSSQIRIRGTVGGNICNAVPSADSIGPLLVFDAECIIAGTEGERKLPLSAFFQGVKKTALLEGELLKSISVPEPDKDSGSAYIKYTRRNAMDLALFGVSCYIVLDGNKVKKVRIALTTASPTPMRATDAEDYLTENMFGGAEIKKAAELAASQAKPRSSWRSSAEFRKALARELTERTITLAVKRAQDDTRGQGND